MKRKNLFLSLISSIVVAIAIVTVTIVSVVSPKSGKNNGNGPIVDNINISDVNAKDAEYELENKLNRDGSEELPYIIYSVESFNKLLSQYGSKNRVVRTPVTELVVDENGEAVSQYKRDENGRIVFEDVLDGDNKNTFGVYNFELVCDIDFANSEFVTLFNDGTSFIGNIDGKNFSLKNISINVTEENFESNFTYNVSLDKIAHIAVFGNTKGATINNLVVDKLTVNVADEVYSAIVEGRINSATGSIAEVQVAGLIANAKDTEISNLKMNAVVTGSTYKVQIKNKYTRAISGVAAYADGLTIRNSEIDVEVKINAGETYYAAGVSAVAFNSTIADSKVNASVEATYSRRLVIAGVFAYAKGIEVSGVEVNFNLTETAGEEERNGYVSALKDVDTNDTVVLTKAAGVAAEIIANDDTQKSVIENTKVFANIDFDCVFSGLVSDVYSTNKIDNSLVTIKNFNIDMNVNVLAFHAIARQLVATNVTVEEGSLVEGYNIVVNGSAKLEKYLSNGNLRDGATIFTAVERNVGGAYYVTWENSMFFIKVSKSAQEAISKGFDKDLLNFVNGTIVVEADVIPGAYTIVD